MQPHDIKCFLKILEGHGGLALNPTSSASPVKSRPGSSTGSIASGGNFKYIIETLVSDQRNEVFLCSGGGRNSADPSTSSSMLVMSGGEGYIDFRIGERHMKRSNYSGWS